MNLDKMYQHLMKIDPTYYARINPLWAVAEFLDDVIDNWQPLMAKSPNQHKKLRNKFWIVAECFCKELSKTDDKHITPKAQRLLRRLHEHNSTRCHQLMLDHPKAWRLFDEEWASWTRYAV